MKLHGQVIEWVLVGFLGPTQSEVVGEEEGWDGVSPGVYPW